MKLNLSSLIKDNELSEKYNEIVEKVKDSLKKESDSELVHNKKYLKAEIKSYNEKINTNFHSNINYQKTILNMYLIISNFDRFCL